MKKAVIDVGTNSTLLLIADVNGSEVKNLEQKFAITRLGEGVVKNRILQDKRINMTVKKVTEYIKYARAQNIDDIYIIGTQALRVAQNSKHFTKSVYKETGISLEIISGEEEAYYSYLGGIEAADAEDENLLVIDVGGGSTEFVFGNRSSITSKKSIPLGAVRLAEKFDMKIRLAETDIRELMHVINQHFNQVDFAQQPVMIAVGGTATTIVTVCEKMKKYDENTVHGYRLSVEKMNMVFDLINSHDLKARKEIPGLEPGREDVILYGILVYQYILNTAKTEKLTVSDKGLRFGFLKNMTNN